MPRIQLIPPRNATGELRAAYADLGRRMGARAERLPVPRILQCFSHRPRLLRAAADGYWYAGWCGQVPRALKELVAILVAREGRCFY